MTGGGFGGCVVALIPEDLVPAVRRAVAQQYEAKTGIRLYVCKPSQEQDSAKMETPAHWPPMVNRTACLTPAQWRRDGGLTLMDWGATLLSAQYSAV